MPYMQIQSMLIFCVRSSKLTEETLASIVAESSQRFINQNKLCDKPFEWENQLLLFQFPNRILIKSVNTYLINQSIIAK